ncbi:hypothetical protein G7Y89_g14545 [Cudoniella acicularis]|uniref:SH3 domain-containing protein n=1 Tax=Cudoniella acicularis TaxID=354080 RepID=A0A8H4R1A2_9HELO|nr:hypothetical protein G7Y89_g14545 [Cudoniella acicularis]
METIPDSSILGAPKTEPSPSTSSSSPESANSHNSSASKKVGLGINFYDHKGNVRRWRNQNSKAEEVKEVEVPPSPPLISPSTSLPPSPSLSARTSNSNRSNRSATVTSDAEPEAQQEDDEEDDEDDNLTVFTRSPLPTNLETDPILLITKLLEDNYRGQAETFVRASRRVNSKSLSRSVSAGSANCYSPGAASVPGTATATVCTPPHGNLAAIRRSASFQHHSLGKRRDPVRTPSGRVVVELYSVPSRLSPSLSDTKSPHRTYGHRVYSLPSLASPAAAKKRSHLNQKATEFITRGPFYFTEEEREGITELVLAHPRSCEKHENCTDCREIEYSFHENKAMPTSIPPEERQKIINNNRSLRNIKNELENLAENGAISDEVFDTIMKTLPNESSLNASGRGNAAQSPVPTNAFSNMRVNDPPPPAYSTPTPPSLPSRGTPSKPEIARATALYRYIEADDCNFEVGDQIAVYEYMNADWWLGKNVRTGKEGVFPVNYVQIQNKSATPSVGSPTPHGIYGNEKANNAYQPPVKQQGPPPPGPSDPYKSSIPPMQITSSSSGAPSKGSENGKKFGKKLGNAAIFGAGASIGGKIVNGIF